MLEMPNLPHPDVPVGPDERANVVVRTVGDAARRFDFTPRPHWELGDGARHHRLRARRQDLGLALLRAARRRRAAAARAHHLDARPAHRASTATREIYPPAMVKRECLVGTGNLPKFGDNLYRDAEEDFWFVPTAEVPVTNLYRDEILERRRAADPARRLHAVLPAREDVGRARRARHQARPPVRQGRDGEVRRSPRPPTPSCWRCSTTPRTSAAASGSAHRVVQMCTGDLSFAAAMKYDVEVWAPGCGEWLEVSSCSNFRDFQARRANIRYRPGAAGEARARAHAERLGAGAAARPDRRARDLPAGRRLGRDPRGAAPVHARPRRHRADALTRLRRWRGGSCEPAVVGRVEDLERAFGDAALAREGEAGQRLVGGEPAASSTSSSWSLGAAVRGTPAGRSARPCGGGRRGRRRSR